MISLNFDLCSSSPYYCGYPTFFSHYIVTVIPSASMATPQYHPNRYRKCKEAGSLGEDSGLLNADIATFWVQPAVHPSFGCRTLPP